MAKKKAVLLFIVVLFIASGIGWYIYGLGRESTDDAFVDGKIFAVITKGVRIRDRSPGG